MSADADISAESSAHPAPHRARVSGWLLAFGLIGAPAAWLTQNVFSYGAASYACFPHDVPLPGPSAALSRLLVLATVIAIAIGVAGLFAALQGWRATREEKSGSGHHALAVGEGRTRFLALSGILTSAMFLIAVAFSAVTLFVSPSCY
ncbi:MAG: hypothetical protein ABI612_19950 [Betaproteobacteria bacterium]